MEAVPSVGEVYHRLGAKYGSRKSVVEVTAAFKRAFAATESQPDLGIDSPTDPWWTSEEEEFRRWEKIVGMVFDDVTDLPGCFRELHDHFALPSAWRVFPDVAPTIATLRERGMRVVLASNFDDRLHSVHRGSDDLRLLDACFISSELGVRKPSVGFYRQMLTNLEVSPQELLMVGDDLQNDVYPPSELGIQAVWLNRSGAVSDHPSIRSLAEILPLLKPVS